MILGTVNGGVEEVRSWPVGSGVLADELITSDPPSAAEIRKVRDRIDDIFAGVEIDHPEQAVAVGGSATSLRKLVGTVLEYETLERGVRVLCGDPAADVARRFELDPVRVRILPTGVLLLEKVSELLGQPLQIGKGGLARGGHPGPAERRLERAQPREPRCLTSCRAVSLWGRRSSAPPTTRSLRSLQVFWEGHPTTTQRTASVPQKLNQTWGWGPPSIAFSFRTPGGVGSSLRE